VNKQRDQPASPASPQQAAVTGPAVTVTAGLSPPPGTAPSP